MSEYEELVRRLRYCANDTYPFATSVSNMGRPEADNNFGRAAVAMREAADAIVALEANRDKFKELLAGHLAKAGAILIGELDDALTKLQTAEAELAKWRERWEKAPIRMPIPHGQSFAIMCSALEGKRVRILVEE